MNAKIEALKNLMQIPGVGKSIANDLWQIDIRQIDDLKDKIPEQLYELSNQQAGCVQDRCLLYVFRCAVYYAQTPKAKQQQEKLKWWYWKDAGLKIGGNVGRITVKG